MDNNIPVQAPGGFAPAFALGHDDGTGNVAIVSRAAPLPTAPGRPPVPSPLSGTVSADTLAGPFAPAAFTPVLLELSGDWTGSVQVLRSVDGGATKLPLTVAGSPWARFTANACEPVWEESEPGAELFLDLRPTSGSVAYRLAQ